MFLYLRGLRICYNAIKMLIYIIVGFKYIIKYMIYMQLFTVFSCNPMYVQGFKFIENFIIPTAQGFRFGADFIC